MTRALGPGLLLASLIVACGGATKGTSSAGAQKGALETYRDGCDAAACGDRPAPRHRCVGGYAVSVCTKARGACGWQIDCSAERPPEDDGDVSVGTCDANATGEQACGPVPAYDDKDCVYGFLGEPQCERYGSAPCAWTRRCRPQPCDQQGTCNTIDRSKLGAPCGLDTPCPAGSMCASITANLGESVPPTCIEGDGCGALTCAAGLQCQILESYPAQIRCGR